MSQYHDLFLSETREHLKKFSELTLILEADHEDRTTIDALFRSAHSVKGMAASMGFADAAKVAHKLEDLMDCVRKGLAINAGLFDLLLAGEATLSKIVDDIAGGGSGKLDSDDLLKTIDAYKDGIASPVSVPDNAAKPLESIPEPRPKEEALQQQQTVKIKTAVLDHFLDTTGELITVKHRLTTLTRNSRDQELSHALLALEKHLRELHDQVMGIRLMPLSVIMERFPRMVRDLARSLGKEIALSIQGAEIELDRSILDLIGDPLSHLLRNSVDHGIETPAERIAQGKTGVGKISVSVSREKDQVAIRVEDDGRGMNPDQIAESAIARGFVTKEKTVSMSDGEKLLLTCHPGFSTARKVTEVSGRGVGMDVVKTAIQTMGGSLAIFSESGKGSEFQLRLPLTVAIINVLLVKTGRFTLAIPLTAVSRTLELRPDELATVDGREVLFLGDETLPVLPLGRIINERTVDAKRETVKFFITETKGQRVALQVDQLLGNQEVFVKPLPRPIAALQGITGATVLGSGEVVFILDIFNKL